MNVPRLLLVDDEPNIIKALQRLFFDEDYDVHAAPSGEAGLEILQAHEVDLIIADYRMGGMNGIEFLSQARNMQPDAVRIILSGYAEIRALTDAINEGNIYRFIFKPWNDEELKNTIRLALQQKKLVLENRSLAQELQQKNEQLEDFNRRLETQVAQRTRELLYQNRVLSIAQQILELVPVAVVGYSDEGVVVIMNQLARSLFPVGLGQMIEDLLPPHLAAACRSALTPAGKEADEESMAFETTLDQRVYGVQISRFHVSDTAKGAVLILGSTELPPKGGPIMGAAGAEYGLDSALDVALRMVEPA